MTGYTLRPNPGKCTMHIIYRVCDAVDVCSAPKRCFPGKKRDIISTCLDSMLSSISRASKNIDIDVNVVEDGCSNETLHGVLNTFSGFSSEWHHLGHKGNAESFCKCVEIAAGFPDDDIVFLLEDDYFFLVDNLFDRLAVGLDVLRHRNGRHVAIMPDDYPDRYLSGVYQGGEGYSEVHVTEIGHFMRIAHTTCTFATYAGVCRRHQDLFRRFRCWPRVREDGSINLVWGKVPLYQPIPAWTMHSQLRNIVPKYVDFDKVYEKFECRADEYKEGS